MAKRDVRMIPQDLEFKISGKLVPSLIAIPNVELKDYTNGLSAFVNEHVSQAHAYYTTLIYTCSSVV